MSDAVTEEPPAGAPERVRVRVRVRRDGPPPRRSRWRRWWPAALVLALLVAGALVALDGLAVRRALTSAAEHVSSAEAALSAGTFDQAEQALAEAATDTGAARNRSDGPLWAVGRRVPILGRTPATIRDAVDLATAAVDLGTAALARREVLLDADGDLRLGLGDGGVDLAVIREAAQGLGQLPLDGLVAVRDRLAARNVSFVPGVVRAGRRDALTNADRAIDQLVGARDLTAALPGFLGGDRPRRYLLLFQNPAELRGTGGLASVYGLLAADDGRLEMLQVGSSSDFGTRGEYDPVDGDPAFHARYQHVWADSFTPNANVDPDLPTTAANVLALYDRSALPRVDGIIAVDPVAIGALLGDATVTVPGDVTPDGEPLEVSGSGYARLTMVDSYELFADNVGGHDPFVEALASASFDALLDVVAADGLGFARRLGPVTAGRHLQVFSRDADERQAFQRLGAGGRLRADGAGDLLALTANNAGGNKQDVHVTHRLDGTITLEPVGGGEFRRRADLRVGLDNPLPTSGMTDAIIGSIPTSTLIPNDPRFGTPGLNRTWFTLWSLESTRFVAATDVDGQPLSVGAGALHGESAVDHHLETPSRSSNAFGVELLGTVPWEQDGPDRVYRLTVWRQAKAIVDHLDLRIEAPDGWEVAEVALTGGGQPDGMSGGGDAVTARRDGAAVVVSGAATDDVVVEIRYRKGLLSRAWAWFTGPL